MIEPAKFALFAYVSLALVIAPGPDMFYVISRGVAHGRKAGIVSAIGVICGILVHTTAATLGVTLILETSAYAFQLVKYLGVYYLIYLGIKSWRDESTFNSQPSTTSASSWTLFRQGVLSNVLNPKIAMFFLAFLPQFVDKESSQMSLQMAFLGLTFACFGLCVLAVIGYSAGAIGGWLTRRPYFAHFLHRFAGGILIALGLRLAFTKQ